MLKNCILALCALVLASCAPSAGAVGTAIALTQTAAFTPRPADTVTPAATTTAAPTLTNTAAPSATAQPTATATRQPLGTPTQTWEEYRTQFLDVVTSDLANVSDVETVTVVRFNSGKLEIELKTKWASQDSQPDVSYKVILFLASGLEHLQKSTLDFAAGGPFEIALTTYSTLGDYRYQSLTDYPTMLKVAHKAITYAEWVAAANAGFR